MKEAYTDGLLIEKITAAYILGDNEEIDFWENEINDYMEQHKKNYFIVAEETGEFYIHRQHELGMNKYLIIEDYESFGEFVYRAYNEDLWGEVFDEEEQAIAWATGYHSLEADDIREQDFRICSVCGNVMDEGYCEDGGLWYACSDKCLHTKYTDEEWEQACTENEDNYYTDWR